MKHFSQKQKLKVALDISFQLRKILTPESVFDLLPPNKLGQCVKKTNALEIQKDPASNFPDTNNLHFV